jgi:hypothetical protein
VANNHLILLQYYGLYYRGLHAFLSRSSEIKTKEGGATYFHKEISIFWLYIHRIFIRKILLELGSCAAAIFCETFGHKIGVYLERKLEKIVSQPQRHLSRSGEVKKHQSKIYDW